MLLIIYWMISFKVTSDDAPVMSHTNVNYVSLRDVLGKELLAD
jgi:hypothetical protein